MKTCINCSEPWAGRGLCPECVSEVDEIEATLGDAGREFKGQVVTALAAMDLILALKNK